MEQIPFLSRVVSTPCPYPTFFCAAVYFSTSHDSSDPQVEWAEKVNLVMSNLTGPAAPHYFRMTKRKWIGAGSDGVQELRVSVDDRAFRPNADDVVMVVKDMMGSVEVLQIILMVPAADLPSLHALPRQPKGIHTRRPISDTDRKKVQRLAEQVTREGAITPKACNYLVEWAGGSRRRYPKPATYNFLNHRVAAALAPIPSVEGPMQPAGAFRPVRVLSGAGGRNLYLPEDPESQDEAGDIMVTAHGEIG